MILSMTGGLLCAAFKVFRFARESITMHQNPGYILYSNPKILHTWGFLYVSYRATAYYWVFPNLLYIFIKGAFIGLGQSSPLTQTVGLLCVETVSLIFSSIFRPWMDRRTNTFNIAIFAVHFVNAVFLLMFTSVFNQPVCPRSARFFFSFPHHKYSFHTNRITNFLPGSSQLYNGRHICFVQRRFRSCTLAPGPCICILCYFLKESRSILPTRARQPGLLCCQICIATKTGCNKRGIRSPWCYG
jgi:Transient receptor potential (TRP) ion channel